MRFGGHETFPVREGWLYKGINLIREDPDGFNDPLVGDTLGVGRNMAKSIRYWLVATKLARPERSATDPKRKRLVLTEIGETISEQDPFFLQNGTWAALHINLLNHTDHACAWSWFFGRYSEQRFDRMACIAALQRHVERTERRPAASRTLQRDVACLLSSYASPVPQVHHDPEDASDSPFRRLGLITHFRDSNLYRRNEADFRDLPPELLGYGLVSCGVDAASVPMREACFYEGGPGRALQLSLDSFMDFVDRAERSLPTKPIRLIGSAGERRIQLARLSAADWLRLYYDRTDTRHAAA